MTHQLILFALAAEKNSIKVLYRKQWAAIPTGISSRFLACVKIFFSGVHVI